MNIASPRDGAPSPAWSDLRLRVVSGAALAVLAIALGVIGGWPLTALAAVMSAIVAGEWISITRGQSLPEVILGGVVAGTVVVIAGAGAPLWALVAAAVGAVGVGVWLRNGWAASGIVYGAALGIAVIVIRADPLEGLRALGFVAAVVWGTDIAAYFVGRRLGGPKLWPRVSPNKTWSGALGGLAVAAAAATLLIWVSGGAVTMSLVVVALVLSVFSQAGDLFESGLKRRFGVKDSSKLIPGHGGLMDRVDGLVFASVAAAFIGWFHMGGPEVGQGLLLW